jgi:hypothetical protein
VGEEPEVRRFNPTAFAMVVTLFVFSAASFVAPGYAGIGDPLRWLLYAVGVLSYLAGCVGFAVAVGNAYGGDVGFRLSVYVLGLFTVVAALHLATVYVPMPGWVLIAVRLFTYLLVLPLSLLTMLGVFRVIGGLGTSEHRTDAALALLALLGALLPILVSLFSNPTP